MLGTQADVCPKWDLCSTHVHKKVFLLRAPREHKRSKGCLAFNGKVFLLRALREHKRSKGCLAFNVKVFLLRALREHKCSKGCLAFRPTLASPCQWDLCSTLVCS